MRKIDLGFEEDLEDGIHPRGEKREEPEENGIQVQASSRATVPNGRVQMPGVSSKVISPIPMTPAEMARMLALGKEKFGAYETMVNDLVHQASELVVSDQASHDQAVSIGLRAKKLGKEVTEKEKSYTKQASDFVKGLRSFVKPFTDGCDKIERITKDKNRDWMALKELERRKQEKILADAQKEVQKKVDEEAKAAGVQTVQLQPPIVRQEEKIITRTQDGSAHLTHKKDWKVINLSAIPREILQRAVQNLSEKAQREFLGPIVNEEIKRNPDVEIDGILIFPSTGIIYRT